jgi:hypothetical protein
MVSCINPFAPELVNTLPNRSNVITSQKSPDEVLQNFLYAYTFKDSLVYADIIDSAFIFRTWDYEQVPPVPVEWFRDEELRITGRMFRAFNRMDLVWNRTIYQDTVATNLIEMRKSFTLTIEGGQSIPVLNGEVIFRFIKRSEKWYLLYWEDLKI